VGADQHDASVTIDQAGIGRLRRRVEPPVQDRERRVDRTRDEASCLPQILAAGVDEQRATGGSSGLSMVGLVAQLAQPLLEDLRRHPTKPEAIARWMAQVPFAA
jgi:hypothetical protein